MFGQCTPARCWDERSRAEISAPAEILPTLHIAIEASQPSAHAVQGVGAKQQIHGRVFSFHDLHDGKRGLRGVTRLHTGTLHEATDGPLAVSVYASMLVAVCRIECSERKSVRNGPGETVVILIPNGAASWAKLCEAAHRADFEAA